MLSEGSSDFLAEDDDNLVDVWNIKQLAQTLAESTNASEKLEEAQEEEPESVEEVPTVRTIKRLPPGAFVQLDGLSNMKFNGKIATIKAFDRAKNRYIVEFVDDKRCASIKSENLALVEFANVKKVVLG